MDVFSKKKRSEIMSRIRGKNTLLEKEVFSHLRKNKIHFQKHYLRLLGKPDIALPSQKKAIFIDGDFWHGWRFTKNKNRLPEVYWREKIERNIARDRANRRRLRRMGWRIIRIWEHELKKKKVATLEKITNFLKRQ